MRVHALVRLAAPQARDTNSPWARTLLVGCLGYESTCSTYHAQPALARRTAGAAFKHLQRHGRRQVALGAQRVDKPCCARIEARARVAARDADQAAGARRPAQRFVQRQRRRSPQVVRACCERGRALRGPLSRAHG